MKKSFLSPSKLKAAVIYVFMILLAPSFLAALIGLMIGPSFGVDGGLVASSFFEKVEDSSIELARGTAMGYGSFISYLLAFLLIGFFMRNYLIEDFLKLKNNKKIYNDYEVRICQGGCCSACCASGRCGIQCVGDGETHCDGRC